MTSNFLLRDKNSRKVDRCDKGKRILQNINKRNIRICYRSVTTTSNRSRPESCRGRIDATGSKEKRP